jgi:hypothetical protein
MVQELQRLGVSERMACRVVGLARSSFRYALQPPSPHEASGGEPYGGWPDSIDATATDASRPCCGAKGIG